MKRSESPVYEGWKFVGEEPFDEAKLAALRSNIETSRFRARWFGVAAIATTLFLVSGPLLVGATFNSLMSTIVTVGLFASIALEVFFVLSWWGGRSYYKHYCALEKGGGYWVYEPLDEEAVENWLDGEGGDISLDPDGKRREPKGG